MRLCWGLSSNLWAVIAFLTICESHVIQLPQDEHSLDTCIIRCCGKMFLSKLTLGVFIEYILWRSFSHDDVRQYMQIHVYHGYKS